MNENVEYADACAEVKSILKHLVREDYKKIPQYVIDAINESANEDKTFNYNPNIPLENQNVLETTKLIIASLFEDYWATDNQKEKLKEINKEYDRKIELQKHKKYNPDNIFMHHKINTDQELNNNALIEYKEPFLIRFKNFIFKILNIKKD